MKDLFPLLSFGRIENIINALKKVYNVDAVSLLSEEIKIDALCRSLGLSIEAFDNMLANNSPVLRTVKGHSFEVAFERILTYNNISVSDIGGDSDIDLQIGKYSLQLKTPNLGGSTEDKIEYKTHKTHGAKSERESMDYYHKVDDFADYFVGLISYSPFKVFIIPKEKLPRHRLDNRYIQSPFKLDLLDSEYSKYINAFHLLDFSLSDFSLSKITNGKDEILPLTSSAIGVCSGIILDTILRECNFRIWDMSIRGFAREVALKQFFDKQGVKYSDRTTEYKKERGDKADLVIWNDDGSLSFLQVKGISTNNCNFQSGVIATETQLTRGRVNDHPTQSRLYLATDFDFLILATEPCITYMVEKTSEWSFFMVPTSELRRHPKIPHRINHLQKFLWKEIVKYRL